jgi:flagellar biogenesis protein FliO
MSLRRTGLSLGCLAALGAVVALGGAVAAGANAASDAAEATPSPAPTSHPVAGLEAGPVLAPAVSTRPSGPEGGLLRRSGRDSLGDWGRTFLALGIVVVIVLGLRFVLRRFARATGGLRGGAIEVLSRTNLLPRQHLFLVRLGRRLILVGSSPAGLTALSVVSEAEEVVELSDVAMGAHGKPVPAIRSGGKAAPGGEAAKDDA